MITTTNNNKGFTLIELLVVIAIVGVLAAVVLLAINPAELLRRSRDTTRLSDMTTLRKAIDTTFANDPSATWFAGTGATCAVATTCPSSGTRTVNGTGWIPMNFQGTISTLPRDPRQGVANTAVTTGVNATATLNVTPIYNFRYNAAGQYELNTFLESTSNWERVSTDGGDNNGTATVAGVYEVGTLLTLIN